MTDDAAGRLAWYDELRNQYRPDVTRLLLIGESPPDPRSGERRFFYSPKLGYDNLYRGAVEALYGSEQGFDVRDKVGNLGRLRAGGVWLVDAVAEPVNAVGAGARRLAIRSAVPGLIERCMVVAPTVGVLICHSVVYAETSDPLRQAGVTILHDEPLPFPLGNMRRRFVIGAREAPSRAGWSL